ncbi:hypothetical protein HJFPF1_12694 [Paramyrothecium foliicola]|nr:hypothetical protein HJFPF1_12694 [Paramyrothecium foliicola]
MPLYAPEIERWWLTSGVAALTNLLDTQTFGKKPGECGFSQVAQSKIRIFDNDRTLLAEFRASMPGLQAGQALNYAANPRRNLSLAALHVFRNPEEGGLNYSKVMEGLALIDAVEVHRVRVLAAAQSTLGKHAIAESYRPIMEEIHQTASLHYSQCHMGFRACALVRRLFRVAGAATKARIETMACLNAMFPATNLLSSSDDIDPSPCSPGLRDSIRFSVFDHLVSTDTFSREKQKALEMKLFCWCDIPGYPQAYNAFMLYAEEAKKLEDVCLEAMHACEGLRFTFRRRASSTELQNSASSEGFRGSDTTVITPVSRPYTPNGDASTDTALSSRASTSSGKRCSTVPSVPSPLLGGMPGREISAAKTDMAFMAGDFDTDPVRAYPHDLSLVEFCQHPLARDLDFDDESEEDESNKKPAMKSSSRSFGARRRQGSGKSITPPVPSLPPIPELLTTTLVPRVFEKIVRRIRARPHASSPNNNTPIRSSQLRDDSATDPQPRATKSRPVLKPRISNPRIQQKSVSLVAISAHSDTQFAQEPESEGVKFPEASASSVHTISSSLGSPTSPISWTLAKPRLSPMEYVRLYLIEKSHASKAGQPCRLPEPEKLWFWTPRWEKFLILPQVPPSINRGILTSRHNKAKSVESRDLFQSVTNFKSNISEQSAMPTCPRLSLNLGGLMPGLFPSVIDLKALQHDTANLNSPELLVHIAEPVEGFASTSGDKVLATASSVAQTHPQQQRDHGVSLLGQNRGSKKPGDGCSASDWPLGPSLPAIEAGHRETISSVEHPFPPSINSARCHEVTEENLQTDSQMAYAPTKVIEDLVDSSSIYSHGSTDSPDALEQPDPLSASQDTLCPPKARPFSLHVNNPPKCSTALAHSQSVGNYSPASMTALFDAASPYSPQFSGLSRRSSQTSTQMSPNKTITQGIGAWARADDIDHLPSLHPAPLRIARKLAQHNQIADAIELGNTQTSLDLNLQELQSLTTRAASRRLAILEPRSSCVVGADVEQSLDAMITSLHEPIAMNTQVISPSHTVSQPPSPQSQTFAIGPQEPSGFTPRRRKKPEVKALRPDSPTLPSMPGLFGVMETSPPSSIISSCESQKPRNFGLDSKKGVSETPRTIHSTLLDSTNASQSGARTRPDSGSSVTLSNKERSETSDKSVFSLSIKRKDAMTILPSTCAPNSGGHGTLSNDEILGDTPKKTSSVAPAVPFTPERRRPKHIPISIEAYQFATQRGDLSGRNKIGNLNPLPPPRGESNANYPSALEPGSSRTASVVFGSLFRKRTRSEQHLEPPKTPTTPKVHWRPFEADGQDLPGVSSWAGDGMNRVARDKQGTSRSSSARSHEEARKSQKGDDLSTKTSVQEKHSKKGSNLLRRKVSMDMLLSRRHHVETNASPPPPLPLPPIPRSTTADAGNLNSASLIDGGNLFATYKSKKSRGLKIDTNKARNTD